MADDIETLKAWCHWKRLNSRTYGDKEIDESEMELVTAVENVISQVGTWKAKYERSQEMVASLYDVIDMKREAFKLCQEAGLELIRENKRMREELGRLQ